MTKSDFLLAIGALLIFQVYATVLVIKSEHFDERTKMSQFMFIWLLPLIGAVLVRIALNAADRAPRSNAAKPVVPETNDPSK